METTFINVLLRSRPCLIVGLSVASGYTTFTGLELYVRWWPIALVMTAAVQSLVVIATLQLTAAYWRASASRVVGILSCLLMAVGVSVFFSYFAFYEQFEGNHLIQRKFVQLAASIDDFADKVNEAKSSLVSAQAKTVKELRDQARLEALGKNGKQGKGPKYRTLEAAADEQGRILAQMQSSIEAEKRAMELKAFLLRTKPTDLASPEGYVHLQSILANTTMAADRFTVVHGLPPIKPPVIMSMDEYQSKLPSIHDLARISPVAASLAVLMDLFTIFLTFWLESVPFGWVSQKERDQLVEELMQFSDWHINRNNAFAFRFTKTEEERSEGVNDGKRQFWACSLLSRGLLRRVDSTRVEFAPRLYQIFIDYFCRREQTDEKS